ncbi:hypothetical protein [Streptomyces arboris]|uniref:hypothetical protein n=1 Tax=Streptomyces arboris TaxID=2600619 RepID=UPI00100851F8
MGGSVMDVVHGALLVTGGLLVAVIGGQSWRRKSSAPVSAGPLWVVRCGSVGWVLMGCSVASLGGYSLAGREEDWPLGPARDAGLVLMLITMAVGVVVQLRRRYAARRGGRDAPGRV